MRILMFFVSATLVLLGACSTEINEKKKLNLLFLWTDQQRFDTMKAYGNDKIKTPNLNKLTDESIVFKRAYVTQPVCTPARSSVMTGLYPHASGCVENNIPLKRETKTVPELINDPEYKTAYMGKWHLGDEVFPQHGFDEWYAIEDGYHRFYSEGRDKNIKSAYHHWLIGRGIQPDANGRFSRGLASNLPLEMGKPAFLAEKATDFIERNRDNPFILYVNFLEPHSPFSSTLNEYHNPDSLALTEDNTKYEELTYRNKMRRMTKDSVKADNIPDFVRRYWGLVSKVDMSVGAILDRLESLGLKEKTLIVFTSDHGEMLGSHSFKAKRFAYDEAARVPLILKLPTKVTQRIVEAPVSHIDIVPTILDIMGYETEDPLQGKSLLSILEGEDLTDNYVYFEMAPLIGILQPEKVNEEMLNKLNMSEAQANDILNARYRAVVSPDGWKMVVSDLDKNQLYNLNDDPEENNNLYNSKVHVEVINSLSEKLKDWQVETNDELSLRF